MRKRQPGLELQTAIRPRVFLKYSGQLWIVLTTFLSVNCLIALIAADYGMAGRYGGIAAVLVISGIFLGRMRVPSKVRTNEALAIVAFAFIVASLASALAMTGTHIPFVDAFFEAVSGVTTTGLSTLNDVESRRQTFQFARAWLQWSGGLGIVVFSVALLLPSGIASKRLAIDEVHSDDTVGNSKIHFKRIIVVYAVLTLISTAGLWVMLGDGFEAMLYSFASVSTGGFAPNNDSIAGLALGAQVFITFICLAASISLALYYQAFTGDWKRLWKDVQLRSLVYVSLFFTVLCSLFLILHMKADILNSLIRAPIMVMSAQTTAGFSNFALATQPDGLKLLLIFSMFIGGGLGSTAGGFKIFRLLIVLRCLHLLILKTALPRHAVTQPHLAGRPIYDDEIRNALLLFVLYIAIAVLSWFPFLVYGYDPVDSLFEVISALGTVGLSSGLVGPELALPLKLVLCCDMLLGRLEIIALLVLCYPRNWIGRRKEVS